MTATVGYLQCIRPRGGNVSISAYFAGSDATGAYLPLDTQGVAVAGSDKSVVMPHDAYFVDYYAGPATGSWELMVDGQKAGVMVDQAAHTAANTGRTKFSYPIRKGQKVQVRVIATCAS